MDLRIRPGEPRDLGAVVGLYNEYVLSSPATFEVEPAAPEARREWFTAHAASGRHRLLVAEDGEGAILGWASTSPFRPRAAYLTTVEASVYCRARSVGQGVGSRLYRELFRSIADEDVERIVAGVTLPNPPSLALHRRFGFRHVGTFTRVGRKFGTYWDVAWFERPLLTEPSGGGSDPGDPTETAPVRARAGGP